MEKIFGHDWADIQRAEAGGRLNRPIDAIKPVEHTPTDADMALLSQHGNIEALKAAGFFGSADRLKRAEDSQTYRVEWPEDHGEFEHAEVGLAYFTDWNGFDQFDRNLVRRLPVNEHVRIDNAKVTRLS